MVNDRERYLASEKLGPWRMDDPVLSGPGAAGLRGSGLSGGVPIAVALGTITPLSFQRGMVSADAAARDPGGGLALEDDSGLKACMDACNDKVKKVTDEAVDREITCERAVRNAKSVEEKNAAAEALAESQERYKNDMAAIEVVRDMNKAMHKSK